MSKHFYDKLLSPCRSSRENKSFWTACQTPCQGSIFLRLGHLSLEVSLGFFKSNKLQEVQRMMQINVAENKEGLPDKFPRKVKRRGKSPVLKAVGWPAVRACELWLVRIYHHHLLIEADNSEWVFSYMTCFIIWHYILFVLIIN